MTWSVVDMVMLSVLACLVLVAVVRMTYRAVRVFLASRPTPEGANVDEHPGVSVIIPARNAQTQLQCFLQAVLTQDYPEFEVIVVNDASQDSTREMVEGYMHMDSRVRMTFVPDHVTVDNTRRLAITLGAKAAQYNYLLVMDAAVRPESTHWLSTMMLPFSDARTECVEGFSPYFEQDDILSRLMAYDRLTDCLDSPVSNILYRKDVYFQSSIYHRTQVENRARVIRPEAYLWQQLPDTLKAWTQQRVRRVRPANLMRCLTHLTMLCVALTTLIGWTDVWTLVTALLLMGIRLLVLMLTTAMETRRLQLCGFGWKLIVLDIILPIVDIYLLLTVKNQAYGR